MYYRLRNQLGKYREVDGRRWDKDDHTNNIRIIYPQDRTQEPPPDL